MDALRLHQEALIWDAHRDVTYEAPLQERFLQGWMMGVDLHLPLLQKGGIDVQVYVVCVASERDLPPTAQALKELDAVMAILESNADKIVLTTSIAEVHQARQEGKIAVILGMEGAEPILTELGLLRAFYRFGLRHVGLTWNHRNALADGGYEGRDGGGLSRFGVAVVEEANRLGMVVDVAHMTPAGMKDVLRVGGHPIIHSHGATRAVNPHHPRTVDDDVLKGIAANGGVFCVTTVPAAMSNEPATASLADMLDHVDHAVRVMGADHVGLGADFDVYQSHLGLPAERWLKGLEEVDKWPNVTAGLLERGYAETDVHKIMGKNLARVFGQVMG
jgi:membrane dipeptidase